MRKSLSTAFKLIILGGVAGYGSAAAQVIPDNANNPIILPSTSSSYNQNGFNLPTIPNVTGQDIVRGSGGISCQSSVGSGGPNFDLGVIGSNDMFDRDSMSVYGRITVPLGKRPKRVDCTRLYDLEISRLQMELQLMRAGASSNNMLDANAARQIVSQGSIDAAPRQSAQPFHLAAPPTPPQSSTPQGLRVSTPPHSPPRQEIRTPEYQNPPQYQAQPPHTANHHVPLSNPPTVKCCQPGQVPPYYQPTHGPAYQPYHNYARKAPPQLRQEQRYQRQPVRTLQNTQNLLRR
jgi:hypothetical protein